MKILRFIAWSHLVIICLLPIIFWIGIMILAGLYEGDSATVILNFNNYNEFWIELIFFCICLIGAIIGLSYLFIKITRLEREKSENRNLSRC